MSINPKEAQPVQELPPIRPPRMLELGIAVAMLAAGVTELTITSDHETDLVNYQLVKTTHDNDAVTVRLEREKS